MHPTALLRLAACVAIAGSLPLESQLYAGSRASEAILSRPDLAAYHGWIKYLEYDATVVANRRNVTPSAAEEKRRRLNQWADRILENPGVIGQIRGLHEWAYESPVDGSGQPFMLNIPTDYDPSQPTPLALAMHGLGGNHKEHFSASSGIKGLFQLSVLGRSRAGNYIALSGADAMHALDYVEKHWSIDADRIHLTGGSMGGNGAFMLGAQFPHRFASARPGCGYASDKPIGNLLTLPIYATHSDDDFTVSILHTRGPLERLRELGGQVIYDETSGYGHAVWNYGAANRKAGDWFRQLSRPKSRDVRQINFTALDGSAARSWWASIAEWGSESRPASFKLTVGNSDILYVELNNVRSLEIDLANAPFQPDQDLRVWINGATPLAFPAPLPQKAYLTRTEKGWAIGTQAPVSPTRLHAPGGPNQLYNGERILIVYGTGGSAAERTAMRAGAAAASRNSNASWSAPFGGTARDGVYLSHNLYGDLPTVADKDLTDEQLRRSHLVLIGTAKQNSVVARLQDRLPATMDSETIAFSDGLRYPAEDNAIGLVYYNPEAPSRLIYWVASNEPSAYREEANIPAYMAFPYPGYPAAPATGMDCLIMKADAPTIVSTRSFDSRWKWIRDDNSRSLSVANAFSAEFMPALCDSMRRAAYADFAISGFRARLDAPVYDPATARAIDLERLYYWEPIGVMDLDGDTLLRAQAALVKKGQSIHPAPVSEEIDPYGSYRVAINQRQIWLFVMETRLSPEYRLTDVTMAEAIDKHFPRNRLDSRSLSFVQPAAPQTLAQ